MNKFKAVLMLIPLEVINGDDSHESMVYEAITNVPDEMLTPEGLVAYGTTAILDSVGLVEIDPLEEDGANQAESLANYSLPGEPK